MEQKHVIGSLPLLASVLGRKYGVQICIGGSGAYTNGKTIHLPSLPMDAGEDLLNLVRGYTDHESAHVRETDFELLKAAKLAPLEKHIWNILEDWRVEHCLADIFPGCRQNFDWLIRHVFLKPGADSSAWDDYGSLLLEWILLTVRSWDVRELEKQIRQLEGSLDTAIPGLLPQLLSILHQAQASCRNTGDCISAAREIVKIIREHVHVLGGDTASRQSVQKLLKVKSGALPKDLGAVLADTLGNLHAKSEGTICVATPTIKALPPLALVEFLEAREATTALRTRLQSRLQSTRVRPGHTGCHGRIDCRKLHRLSSGCTRIFRRNAERQSLNTAIHLLVDCSGSMNGKAIRLAGQACFGIASALHSIPGINLAVTAFPGGQLTESSYISAYEAWQTVAPVLKHGERLHTNFAMQACGPTPLAPALWWVFQQMQFLPEKRKLVLILTDGEPDNKDETRAAIETGTRLGFEIYGIGVASGSLAQLLPDTHAQTIQNIAELAPALFGMLQKSLTRSSHG